MNNKSAFEKYKLLKDKINYVYRKIYLNRVLAIQCWQWANNYRFSIGQLKYFFKAYDYRFLSSCCKSNVFYTDITGRVDHENTFINIAQKVDDYYQIINNSKGVKVLFVFNLKTIIRSLLFTYRNVTSEPFSKRLCIAAKICMIMNSIDLLYRINIPPIDKFVFYSIIHESQNLLGQFFKLRKTKVVGLTHGTQFVYKKNIPIDSLNYENLNADCLVWSQMTKDEYISYGINPNSIFVAGYPKDYILKPFKYSKALKSCLVLLCRRQYDESNLHLLEMLSHFSHAYDFYLKLHPSCDYIQYSQLCQRYGFILIPQNVLLVDCMDNRKYDFAIAVNTTSYYEILTAGIPCLRFEDGDTYDLMKGDDNDRVTNADDFNQAINWISKIIISGEIDTVVNNTLSYNLGVGIDKYREILLSSNNK